MGGHPRPMAACERRISADERSHRESIASHYAGQLPRRAMRGTRRQDARNIQANWLVSLIQRTKTSVRYVCFSFETFSTYASTRGLVSFRQKGSYVSCMKFAHRVIGRGELPASGA